MLGVLGFCLLGLNVRVWCGLSLGSAEGERTGQDRSGEGGVRGGGQGGTGAGESRVVRCCRQSPPPDCRGPDSPRALHPAQVALTSLGMRARFVHGDAVIADSQTDGSFEQACDKFEQWVHKEFLATAAA